MTLTLTMGIPAAGKTTEAQRRATLTGARHLTTDAIRINRALNRGGHLSRLESAATTAITHGEHVIVDACSVQADQRARWLALANRLHTPAHLLIVHCPLSVATTRNHARSHPVPGRVMHHYARQMQAALLDVVTESWHTIEHVGCEADRTAMSTPTTAPIITSEEW